MARTSQILMQMYQAMRERFGHQGWWPGQTPLEVCVGAILTQNTAWKNVEKALANLKAAGAMSVGALHAMPIGQLAELIRPAGYYNIKARRLKNFIAHVYESYGEDLGGVAASGWHGQPSPPLGEGDHVSTSTRAKNPDYIGTLPVAPMRKGFLDRSVSSLREGLLSVSGIGRETADSIVLYAAKKATFVVDAYTFRVLLRHRLIEPEADYEAIKDLLESNLPSDVELFNDFHAQFVAAGKGFCKSVARCEGCPLEAMPHDRQAGVEGY